MSETLKVQKFEVDAILPTKGRPGDAGWDISSYEDITIPPNSWKLVRTGIGLTVPVGTYGRIAPRSGLSTKGIMVNAGVVDRTYRGEIRCILVNVSAENSYEVKKNDRIAQLILEKIVEDCVIEEVEMLEDTCRGDQGFGSTGV